MPDAAAADIQVFFAPIGFLGRMGGAVKLTPYPAFMACVLKSHPVSSGCIRLASGDPNRLPSIECRLLQDRSDLETLVRGIRTVRSIMQTDPIASLIQEEIVPGAAVETVEALEKMVREEAAVTFHPIGTCRMGVDAEAVVDPHLRVRGIENLWIADASIMPSHLSANINAACMMIGMKLGKQLVARHP
jgi:choline dehydrogenase